jgi:hypothetical protein
VDGTELAAENDELSTKVNERFGIGGGADGAAPGFAVFLASGGNLLLHVHHDGIIHAWGAAKAQ